MKLYQRLFIALAILAMGLGGLAKSVRAQASGVQPIWANYAVQYVNEFYNPLAGGTLIPNGTVQFRNASGGIDMDDGTADSIPTNFTFDFNGNSSNSVNVNVNGWVTIRSLNAGANFNNNPVVTWNNNFLFSSELPNNTVAPYWGDHFYRTLEAGYTPSRISYLTTSVLDPNPNKNSPFAVIRTFTVEWRDLNINDKTNPNSIASFQLIIRENPMANDQSSPDHRATIEYSYGPNGSGGSTNNVTTAGAAVGAEDSAGFTHINALFTTAADSFDVANNTTARTTFWPPSGLPGRAIYLVPSGRAFLSQWGDGDANLSQIYSTNPQVRTHQNRFVTLDDAELVLTAAATNVPLDPIEGRNAFHGDANHNGRTYDSTFGAYFYTTTSYDAAYIMMYLAGKLAVLPWPIPLPVPGYKTSDIHSTDVSGVVADASNVQTTGSTVLVPITVRGAVNGALSIEMDLKGLDASGVQFVGTRSPDGTLMKSDASTGRVVLATSGEFADGATVGYLELRAPKNANAEFDLTNVVVNDAELPSSHVALKLGSSNVSGGAAGSSLEQNVPNPFVVTAQSQTQIGFNLAAPENVTLRVFNMLGHTVRTLVDGEGRAAGYNTIQWDGRDASGTTVSSGLYYYQIVTPDFTQTVKMQVVR